MLVAQAAVEGLTLLSRDESIARYDVEAANAPFTRPASSLPPPESQLRPGIARPVSHCACRRMRDGSSGKQLSQE